MKDLAQSKRVLIVDEDPYWRDFSAAALKKKGFAVETSTNLDLLENHLAEGPDIVVLGFAAVGERELGAVNAMLDRSTDRRVLVFSTSLPLKTVRQLFRLGATDVTPKLFAPDELVGLVVEELEEEAAESSYEAVRRRGASSV